MCPDFFSDAAVSKEICFESWGVTFLATQAKYFSLKVIMSPPPLLPALYYFSIKPLSSVYYRDLIEA